MSFLKSVREYLFVPLSQALGAGYTHTGKIFFVPVYVKSDNGDFIWAPKNRLGAIIHAIGAAIYNRFYLGTEPSWACLSSVKKLQTPT